MRSKYGTYPEYHTSLDDLGIVTPDGLFGGYLALRRCLECIESNGFFQTAIRCEPQLGKRGLYSTLGAAGGEASEQEKSAKILLDILSYCDGRADLLDVANRIQVPLWTVRKYADVLVREKLLTPIEGSRDEGRV